MDEPPVRPGSPMIGAGGRGVRTRWTISARRRRARLCRCGRRPAPIARRGTRRSAEGENSAPGQGRGSGWSPPPRDWQWRPSADRDWAPAGLHRDRTVDSARSHPATHRQPAVTEPTWQMPNKCHRSSSGLTGCRATLETVHICNWNDSLRTSIRYG